MIEGSAIEAHLHVPGLIPSQKLSDSAVLRFRGLLALGMKVPHCISWWMPLSEPDAPFVSFPTRRLEVFQMLLLLLKDHECDQSTQWISRRVQPLQRPITPGGEASSKVTPLRETRSTWWNVEFWGSIRAGQRKMSHGKIIFPPHSPPGSLSLLLIRQFLIEAESRK